MASIAYGASTLIVRRRHGDYIFRSIGWMEIMIKSISISVYGDDKASNNIIFFPYRPFYIISCRRMFLDTKQFIVIGTDLAHNCLILTRDLC